MTSSPQAHSVKTKEKFMLHCRQLVAVALMSGISGLAAAQSSVTLFGKLDSAYVKKIGSPNKILDEGAQSRFGLRGTEDLGGGLSAFSGWRTVSSPTPARRTGCVSLTASR